MKIDNSPTVVSLGQTEAEKSSKSARVQSGAAPPPAPAGHSALTHLSPTPGNSGQDIDQVRVSDLRQAILEGRLVMSTDRIADGLIASVRDMLGQNEP